MTRIAIVEEMKRIMDECLHESKLKDELNKQINIETYKHEQTGEIKTLSEWEAAFEDFGASGFEDFESFKSECLSECLIQE